MKIIGRLGAVRTFFIVSKHASVWAGSSGAHLWQAFTTRTGVRAKRKCRGFGMLLLVQHLCTRTPGNQQINQADSEFRNWHAWIIQMSHSTIAAISHGGFPNDYLPVMFPGTTLSACVSCRETGAGLLMSKSITGSNEASWSLASRCRLSAKTSHRKRAVSLCRPLTVCEDGGCDARHRSDAKSWRWPPGSGSQSNICAKLNLSIL